MIKKLILVILTFSMSTAFAKNDNRMVLDKVSLQLTAKQWVKTTSANLQISVNAALSNTDLVEMRNEIMANLNKIAKGDWHVTQFNRSQDSSGLEKLYVQAQARVDQKLLTNVNVNAKNVSKPGATYRVQTVDFTPSLEEVEKVKLAVREILYTKIKNELAALNAKYPTQKYSVHSVVFYDGSMPRPQAMKARRMSTMALEMANAPPISVSNKIQMTAGVIVASNRDDD
jgi:hypothetical protein